MNMNRNQGARTALEPEVSLSDDAGVVQCSAVQKRVPT